MHNVVIAHAGERDCVMTHPVKIAIYDMNAAIEIVAAIASVIEVKPLARGRAGCVKISDFKIFIGYIWQPVLPDYIVPIGVIDLKARLVTRAVILDI